MDNLNPPEASYGDVQLSNTCLHYVCAGEGEPLIIVPATVSLIRQWLPLVQFMGNRYKAYFFEMPGHGASTPYPHAFHSRYVPDTVAQLADHLGIEKFTLMGFSFGGLLAMRTVEALYERIHKVILLSPFLSRETLKYQNPQRWILKHAVQLLQKPGTQQAAYDVMHNGYLEKPLTFTLSKMTNIEESILKSKDALNIPKATLDVFAHTVSEIFETYNPGADPPIDIPCYFGMSINDDLIDFYSTEKIVRKSFKNLKLQTFTHPYHQPPEPPTYPWLMQEFGQFLTLLD